VSNSLNLASEKGAATRARPVTAQRTDTLVIDAGIALLARAGFDALSPAAVSREAGLSITAVRSRYQASDKFLFSIWQGKLLHEFLSPIVGIIDSYMKKGDDSIENASAQLRAILRLTPTTQAAMELITVSAYLPGLLEQVRSDFGDKIVDQSKTKSVESTQRFIMFCVIVGLLARSRNTKTRLERIHKVADETLSRIAIPQKIIAMPRVDSSHLDLYPFDTGDRQLDSILESCLQNVGQFGFGRVTTRQIARDAGVSEGLLFSKFESKLSIFTTAASQQTRLGFTDNFNFIKKIEEKYDESLANAIFIREWARPGLELKRSSYLEQLRLSWHIPEVRKAQEVEINNIIDKAAGRKPNTTRTNQDNSDVTLEVAIPTGVVFGALLHPEAWKLPFSAVTPNLFN